MFLSTAHSHTHKLRCTAIKNALANTNTGIGRKTYISSNYHFHSLYRHTSMYWSLIRFAEKELGFSHAYL